MASGLANLLHAYNMNYVSAVGTLDQYSSDISARFASSYQKSTAHNLAINFQYDQTLYVGKHKYIMDLLATVGAPVIVILTRQVISYL